MKYLHIILDRDGVLLAEDPTGAPTRLENFAWEVGALSGLQQLASGGRRVSVVTNQSAIGRGLIDQISVDAVHERLRREALAVGVRISAIFVCPHAPDDGCLCRKPLPGLVHDAIVAADIPADETIFVGDQTSDLGAGQAAGIAVALVLTGQGRRTAKALRLPQVPVYSDLQAMAQALTPDSLPPAVRLAGSADEGAIFAAFEEHSRLVSECTATLPLCAAEAARHLAVVLRAGGRIFVCGNGGSAADAQHFAAELVGRFQADRRAMAVLALTTDSSTLTAIANDLGYEAVFARQLEALCSPGDALVAISTSGNSPNIVMAARTAKNGHATVVAFTGRQGGALAQHADIVLRVPSDVVTRVQEIHELCLHAIAQVLEQESLRRVL